MKNEKNVENTTSLMVMATSVCFCTCVYGENIKVLVRCHGEEKIASGVGTVALSQSLLHVLRGNTEKSLEHEFQVVYCTEFHMMYFHLSFLISDYILLFFEHSEI